MKATRFITLYPPPPLACSFLAPRVPSISVKSYLPRILGALRSFTATLDPLASAILLRGLSHHPRVKSASSPPFHVFLVYAGAQGDLKTGIEDVKS